MFCDRCGTKLEPGYAACPGCGRTLAGGAPGAPAVAAPAVPAVSWQAQRVAQHLKTLGILWIVYGVLTLVGAGFIFLGTGILRSVLRHEPEAFFVPGLVSMLGVLVAVSAVLKIGAGWGLLERAPWARILVLVLAFLNLLNIPFGTALGIYTLVILLPSDAGREYQRLAMAGP